MSKALYPFQQRTVERILESPLNRLVVSYETGLGKTAVAISAARDLNARRILVVTPAVVREHWLAELEAWWPAHPQAATITVGKGREVGLSKKAKLTKEQAYASDIQVVSYSLLDHVGGSSWDLVVFDESHRLKNPASKQSKAARRICEENNTAAVLLLTATLMPNNIPDIWHQLDLVWPGRFGSSKNPKYPSWKFCNRYALDVGNEYGPKWEGINPSNAKELQKRLLAVCSRVTKHEVAHLLPAFMVQALKVEGALDTTDVASWAQLQGQAKLDSVLEWAEDARVTGKNSCILTHLRETAFTVSDKLRANAHVFCITGEQTPEERNAMLAQAKATPGSFVVATMHSVGIGINLGFCTQVLFAELYYRPETMIQALGRFDGFRAKEPVNCTLLIVKNSLDEKIAKMVLNKIGDINQAIKAGVSDEKLQESLNIVKLSEEEAISNLNKALSLEAEYY